jgi:hypothetical protein
MNIVKQYHETRVLAGEVEGVCRKLQLMVSAASTHTRKRECYPENRRKKRGIVIREMR